LLLVVHAPHPEAIISAAAEQTTNTAFDLISLLGSGAYFPEERKEYVGMPHRTVDIVLLHTGGRCQRDVAAGKRWKALAGIRPKFLRYSTGF